MPAAFAVSTRNIKTPSDSVPLPSTITPLEQRFFLIREYSFWKVNVAVFFLQDKSDSTPQQLNKQNLYWKI
jgi:hypothetical protein